MLDKIKALRLPYYIDSYVELDNKDNVICAYVKRDGIWQDNTSIKQQEYKLRKELAEAAAEIRREKNRADRYLSSPCKIGVTRC